MSHTPSHLDIIKGSKWFIIFFTLLVGLAAGAWALKQPTSYKAVVAFDVQIANRASSPEYQYGAYYDLKGAEIFTQHLMSWFKTPSFVGEIYDNAGIGYSIESLNAFTGRFQAKQYSAQNMVVIFSDYNKDTANKLAGAVVTTVEKNAKEQLTNNEQSQFNVVAQKPAIVETVVNPWIAVGVGILAGLGLSVVFVYIREYFRS